MDEPLWDAWIARFPQATVFHTAAWARVLRDTYGYRPVYLVDGDAAAPRAVLPLMEVNSWLTGRRGISLPFTDTCGVLEEAEGSAARLWDEALSFGRSRNWGALELRDNPVWMRGLAPSTTFYGHQLDLQPDPDASVHFGESAADSRSGSVEAPSADEQRLFERFDPAVRRAIRKALQSDLTVEISATADSVCSFYQLLCITRRRHGLPPQPRRYFEQIHRHVIEPGNGCIVLVRRGAVAIAGALFLHFGKRALYKFGASDERYQQLRANNLVMWEAIRWHLRRGFATLDFGRTSLNNAGLRRFKLGWSTRESILHYHRYDYRHDTFVQAADHSSGWHSAVFRRLPSPLSRLAGELLYRHIA